MASNVFHTVVHILRGKLTLIHEDVDMAIALNVVAESLLFMEMEWDLEL